MKQFPAERRKTKSQFELFQKPIKTKVDVIINQWELKVKAGNLLEARESVTKLRVVLLSFVKAISNCTW